MQYWSLAPIRVKSEGFCGWSHTECPHWWKRSTRPDWARTQRNFVFVSFSYRVYWNNQITKKSPENFEGCYWCRWLDVKRKQFHDVSRETTEQVASAQGKLDRRLIMLNMWPNHDTLWMSSSPACLQQTDDFINRQWRTLCVLRQRNVCVCSCVWE